MKKLIFITMILLGLTSCYDQGTVLTGTEDQTFKPFAMKGDTIDFYQYFPANNIPLWVGIHRKHKDVILQFREGKQDKSVILLDKNSKKTKTRIIEGSVMLENDSVVIIKKIK